ncbi:hypothetical protein EDD11_002647 [Mortierella claussenii]|nr:hypothetical protein EDD11_002647 [Mortierella claussenii]
MTSPASSHPYYTPAHSSRPFHTLSNNADSRDGRFKDENRQSSRVSMSHLPPPDQPFSYPPSPQFRVIRETRHISERAHVRHSSQGHPPTYTTGHGFDPAEGRNGSWSDGGSGQDHRITETMRNSCDTLSGPLSSSVSPALQRRGSQRSIRPSVSESDLQTMESTDARVRHLVISREDGLNEGEIDELEEGEEDEEEGSEDELDEESEYGGHRRIQSSQSFAHDYDSGMKRHWYDSNHGPDYHGLSPTYPSQRQYHHQAHSYDESSLRHPSRGLAATATQRPSGHPIHGQQHPQSYPPPRSHPQMPSQHSHTGQYHSQQQLQLQLQQHSRMAHYQHSAPPSDPSEHHSHSQLHPSSSPKTPSRRGPYLSRQRAIMAGLEVTTPSSRYQCQYCQKRFSRPSSLRIHTYSHTGERPFKCSEEGCGRQFSVQSNMRRHLRVHRLGRLRSEFPPPQE